MLPAGRPPHRYACESQQAAFVGCFCWFVMVIMLLAGNASSKTARTTCSSDAWYVWSKYVAANLPDSQTHTVIKRALQPSQPPLPGAQARDKAKETPMERLKRLRAAQISAAFAKESLTSAQKRLATEREHAARLQMQRSLERRSPSPR